MVRVRAPGGRLTAAQWLALDALADAHSDGSLRITTRQALQFHGVRRGNLKANIAASTGLCSPPSPPAATWCATS
jgi:sulfite reductase (ferredoxin)